MIQHYKYAQYILEYTCIMLQISFVLSFLNIIDLLGILPFYVSLGLSLLNSRRCQQSGNWTLHHTSLHNIYIIYKILLHLSPLSSKQGLVDNNVDMPTITEETSIEHVNASLNCGGNNVSNLLTASPDTP